MPYLTIQEARDTWLPADTQLSDAEIQDLIDGAIRSAQRCCGQDFEPVQRSMVVDGSGRSVQPLPAPLQTLDTIEYKRADGLWYPVTYNDIRISGSRKMLSAGNTVTYSQSVLRGVSRWRRYYADGIGIVSASFPYCVFPAGFQNVRITGTWGRWDDVPDDINRAIGLLVRYAGSCDDTGGGLETPFESESVPGGRSYVLREIERNVATSRKTGYADVDSIFASFPGTFGASFVW